MVDALEENIPHVLADIWSQLLQKAVEVVGGRQVSVTCPISFYLSSIVKTKSIFSEFQVRTSARSTVSHGKLCSEVCLIERYNASENREF